MTGLVGIGALDAGQVARARAVYEDAFAEPLRAPFDELMADRFLALVEDGEPVGIAVVRDLGPTGAVFLRYFAVDRGRRGRGVGARFWRALCADLARADRTLLYLDVEDPDEPAVGAVEREVRRRRIAFYARLGAIVLPVRDYTPPHGPRHHRMLLLAADLRASMNGPLRPGGLGEAVRSVYEYRYGIPESDSLVRTTLVNSGLD